MAGRVRRWIQRVIRRPGAFTAKARRAGMTVAQYARRVIAGDARRYGLRTFRQAVLARTLARIRRRMTPAQRRRAALKAARTRRRRRRTRR